jgi:putative endonuclease
MIAWLQRLFTGPRSVGARGERAAAKWLSEQGYQIIGRNVCIAGVEADLLVFTPDKLTVAIVEVKSSGDAQRLTEERVDEQKQRRLARFAAVLHRQPKYNSRRIRFDVVAVHIDKDGAAAVRHHEAAFESPY